jgi:iron complex transport system substrate-binding protein
VGFQNKNLVYDSVLFEKLQQNLIVDVTTPEGVNTELLMALQPDIVFMSYSPGFDKTNTIELLKKNGIVVIQIPDWLEQHPLGRMEWVRFFSLFFNKYDEANRYSDSAIAQYNSVKMKSLANSYVPKVMVGLSFNDQWYVPSGNGYFGTLLKDAGCNYPFQKITSTLSVPYSKEEVLEQCYDADFWLNVTTANSLNDVERIERLAPKFKAFQQKNVFNYTKKLLPRGANDFWEMGVVEPHIILKDLVWIIANKNNDYQPKYYQQLQ